MTRSSMGGMGVSEFGFVDASNPHQLLSGPILSERSKWITTELRFPKLTFIFVRPLALIWHGGQILFASHSHVRRSSIVFMRRSLDLAHGRDQPGAVSAAGLSRPYRASSFGGPIPRALPWAGVCLHLWCA
jgi:hypothetical protein